MEEIVTQGTTQTFKEESVTENNEMLNDARFIVNTYIDNFQTVVYDDYKYPYPHYGITADQYDEMVADMKKGFEEILNNFKESLNKKEELSELVLLSTSELESLFSELSASEELELSCADYPNKNTKAYDIVEDIDLAIDLLIDYHNGKKDSSVLRYLVETYVKCNLCIDKLHN